MNNRISRLVLFSAALVMIGCRAPGARIAIDPMIAVNTLIEAPDDYAASRVGSEAYPVPTYAKFLKGVKICLNPGHGGDAGQRGFKRGPTGVREAEMNLRVAQYLREFLVASGAVVILTREDDVFLSYEDRAAIADEWGADLFVSLHHNAIDGKPGVNYTTVWYHGDVGYRPSNLDLARFLCDGLYDALALPKITDVPLKSDYLMRKDGFAVLRHATTTAALCESSFFTNPEEEQRLRQPEYNLREAHGLFIGLARYAAAGLPRARRIAPSNTSESRASGVVTGDAGNRVVFELDDGLRSRMSWGHDRNMILQDSIVARVNGRRVPHDFQDDGDRYLLTIEVPADLPPGERRVELQFQNMNKNSILNPHFILGAP
ncbi:MAG: N-acetylmuramoyl-L-alanine amidase [Phycisphaerales bacterium]|nr:N-acetylmuramoyl-L-alanine amidase [Phycisphaerales bacterium]